MKQVNCKLLMLSICLFMSSAVWAGELRVIFSDAKGNLLEDAVLEIISPQLAIPEDWDYSGIMDQIDKEFVENVLTVVEGSYVSFPNGDNIHHHVYSFSDNKTFDLPLYIGDSSEPIIFDVAGVTVVGCNIHDWMLGYIYVGKTHLMSKTRADGVASLQNLAAGEYTFKIWHPRARRRDINVIHTVTLESTGTTEYRVELNLGRDPRIRRAPTSGANAY
ncbi:methylamine utilization protein [Gammaproteobacteria bacterium]|nr:methylamine utilization protein [Gammaproteobacteria bacterium]